VYIKQSTLGFSQVYCSFVFVVEQINVIMMMMMMFVLDQRKQDDGATTVDTQIQRALTTATHSPIRNFDDQPPFIPPLQ